MNILINLISLCNRLPTSSTYRNVVEGILANLDKMPDATIFDVADMTFSSRTTVWRMVKMMGYDSYTEFHHEIRNAINQYPYYNRFLPVTDTTSEKEIMLIAAEHIHESSKIIAEDFTAELATLMTDLLYQADQISLYTLPNTSLYFLIQNLAISGKRVQHFYLYPEIYANAALLTEQSIVIANPLEFPDMMDMTPVFKKLKETGATTLLASDATSRYKQYCDYFLFSGEYNGSNSTTRLKAYEMFLIIISEMYRKKYIDLPAGSVAKI